MPAALDYPHIVKPAGEPARPERHPRTRVAMIVTDYLNRGWSAEEIVLQYPYLALAEVHSALAYYHDHREEIDRELLTEAAEAERARQQQPETPMPARLRAIKRQRAR
jgi:uncharacterized protein (DUF433 family)